MPQTVYDAHQKGHQLSSLADFPSLIAIYLSEGQRPNGNEYSVYQFGEYRVDRNWTKSGGRLFFIFSWRGVLLVDELAQVPHYPE